MHSLAGAPAAPPCQGRLWPGRMGAAQVMPRRREQDESTMRGRVRIGDDQVVELAEMFRLMSDPTRLKIILACLDARGGGRRDGGAAGAFPPRWSRTTCGCCARRGCCRRTAAAGRSSTRCRTSISAPCCRTWWTMWPRWMPRPRPRPDCAEARFPAGKAGFSGPACVSRRRPHLCGAVPATYGPAASVPRCGGPRRAGRPRPGGNAIRRRMSSGRTGMGSDV